MIVDHRTKDTRDTKEIQLWAVATNRIMSWGHAPRKSFVAYPADEADCSKLLAWMENRGDFQRVRLNLKLPRLHEGNHLSVYDVPTEISTSRQDDIRRPYPIHG